MQQMVHALAQLISKITIAEPNEKIPIHTDSPKVFHG